MVSVCPSSGEEFVSNPGSNRYRTMMPPIMSKATDMPTVAFRPIFNSDYYPKDAILSLYFHMCLVSTFKEILYKGANGNP